MVLFGALLDEVWPGNGLYGIVLAVASGPLDQVIQYKRAAPKRIIGGAYTGSRDL